MNPLQNASIFIFDTLISLFIMILIIRFLLQIFRVNFRNPICEVIVKISNPIVIPFRRFIPGLFKIDLATLTVIFLLTAIKIGGLQYLYGLGASFSIHTFLYIIGDIINNAIQIAIMVVIAQAVLSWFQPNPYNPGVQFIHSLAEPINKPARRLIPSFSGLDISPIFTILGLSVLKIILVEPLLRGSVY